MNTEHGNPEKSVPAKSAKAAVRQQVFVLRIWQDQAATLEHSAQLRFSLENPQTGNRRGFTDFKTFITFLQEEINPYFESKDISNE